MYFNAQRVRKPGLWTTNHGRASTYPVSHNGGRVRTVGVTLSNCLTGGGHPRQWQDSRREFGKILRREDGSAVAHSVANFRLRRHPPGTARYYKM
jgi:hypothetical protein